MFSTLKRLANKTVDKDTTVNTTTHPKSLSQDLQRSFSKGIQYNLKLVIKGDRNVGKTCLWNRLQGKPFLANYEETDEIQVAHIQWNYKNTEDIVKVEVWDVVDKGKRRPLTSSKSCDVLKTEHDKVKLSPVPIEDTPVLDAELVDVYRRTNGVLLVLDITKRWTLDYVYNELPKIPDNIPVLVLGNHCDMNHHRSINGDEIIYYLKTLKRSAPIRYAEVSMSNGFGLRLIYKWIGISFLQLQRENIMNHLETNGSETKIMTMELDVYQQSNEANYDEFLSRLSKQRRADAENKSVAPTLPLPLLNKPSPNIKEIKSPAENSKMMDSKTQDIAQKMFPGNKSNVVQTELSKCKDVKIPKEEPSIKTPSIININNLDDFVPDDELDKSFLEDAGHGDIIVKTPKETELNSDESDDDCGNPMVAGYQADVDPDDFTPDIARIKIEKNNIESNDIDNWSSIQNTTRPRPEGGEDEESKPHVDGLSNVATKKVKEKKVKSKSEKKNKKKTNNPKSEYENLECFLNDE
ncbi:rab-like protein 6 isoform X1 [Rhopalosiphum maidis]|uniref:rab-like protein 6 isoform X1 n=1 Tax=Rhopalosiphum maidis TaxID=43146 RepID=UPI000EFFA757|nr:rab-like protein 6 isoform X1 [Rhopalosiphum maidis]XP_026804816.1 rab-like protein 6 isoform X1 [Rhopalosiphum maidis]XP_026804817.1 rab-like protein 6 isoform X1 [Rhopalosiphum maidis]